MATDETPGDESDACAAVTEVALEKAAERCGSDEALREQLMRFIGIGQEKDVNCEVALAEGLNEETLRSANGTRQWVMCRAWELVREEDKTLATATEQAWSEARATGEEHGIEV